MVSTFIFSTKKIVLCCKLYVRNAILFQNKNKLGVKHVQKIVISDVLASRFETIMSTMVVI